MMMNIWVMIGLLEVHKVVDHVKDALDQIDVVFDHVDPVALSTYHRAKITRT